MLNRILLLAPLLLLACTACANRREPPGPIRYQQYNATLHDPYPDNDAGPPVVGGRPLDFQKPAAEPVRSRWIENWWPH